MGSLRRAVVALTLAGSFVASTLGAVAADAPAPTPSPQASPRPVPSRGRGAFSLPLADPYPSTYTPFASHTTLIKNATLLTAAGPAIRGGSLLLQDGKIAAIGTDVAAPADAVVIDAHGKYVT